MLFYLIESINLNTVKACKQAGFQNNIKQEKNKILTTSITV